MDRATEKAWKIFYLLMPVMLIAVMFVGFIGLVAGLIILIISGINLQ